jgi:hypothetical protein
MTFLSDSFKKLKKNAPISKPVQAGNMKYQDYYHKGKGKVVHVFN